MPAHRNFWTWVAAGARAARDLWLMIGLAVVFYAVLEGGYRLQGTIRRAMHHANVTNPYSDSTWYRLYAREYSACTVMEWHPYVYFRRHTCHGTYVNVDSLGHRVTVQSRAPDNAKKIFFFGGSTMWGDKQRDAGTIPSVVARDLESQGDTEAITNFGESGYVFTQEALALILQLRAGARPNVVVFYDGINDVASAVQNGRAGIPQNEFNRQREFALGRTLWGWENTNSIAADVRAFAQLAFAAAQRSQLFERLAQVLRPTEPRYDATTSNSMAHQVVHAYTGMARMLQALSKSYGFDVLYIWQPNSLTSGKKPTPFERGLLRFAEANPFYGNITDIQERVPRLLDPVMDSIAPGQYLDLSHIFATDTGAIFMDAVGHTTEAGAREVGDRIARKLLLYLKTTGTAEFRSPGTAPGS